MDKKQGHHLGIRMKQKPYRRVNWKFARVNVPGKYGMIASQLKGLFEASGYKLNARPCSMVVLSVTVFSYRGTSIWRI